MIPSQIASLPCQKDKFDLPQNETYLNCAYQSPLLNNVVAAGIKGIRAKSRPANIKVDDFFAPLEKLKKTFSQLIHCPDPQRIAWLPSASYGIATVVKNLPIKPQGNIILLREQFPSNVYAYIAFAKTHNLEIRYIDPPSFFSERGERWNHHLLNAIDLNTICVSIPHTHWADGTLFDLHTIRQKTLQTESLLIIDGTQSVGALPFNVESINPDALICAGYKFLLGPYSSGLGYFGPFFDHGHPLEYNWITRINSDEFAGLVQYKDEFRPKSYRYNVGECSNFILVPMLQTALEQILEWQVERIQAYCSNLVKPFLTQLDRKGILYEKEFRADHLFGIYLPPNSDLTGIKQKFEQQKINVSFRGSAIRISPHVYNTNGDMQKLSSCL